MILFVQGIVIFYLYCVRRKNVRKLWLPNQINEVFSSLSLSQITTKTSAKSKISEEVQEKYRDSSSLNETYDADSKKLKESQETKEI